jgi:hypothetical protein
MTLRDAQVDDREGSGGPMLRTPNEVAQHLQPFLAMLLSGFPKEQASIKGTGVFIRLRERFFILTAGHCVKDLQRDAEKRTLGLGLLGPRTGIGPTIIRTEYDCDGERDVGVLELSAVDAKRIRTATSNYFLRMDELAIGHVADVAPHDDAYVVAGYPGSLYEDYRNGRWVIQSGGLALLASPRFPGESSGDTRYIELPYSDRGGTNVMSREHETISPIDLAGCSGGGCWSLGSSMDPWFTDRMRLIGIHVGRDQRHGEPRLREVLVGHHLALIGKRIDGMNWLFDEHPCLQDW